MRNIPRWCWVWALLVGLMLFARPALPIDETRYLAVAWEMWWRDSVAVPFLNGQFYEGKPPLFFWLMHLGWWLVGVDDIWPRLIAPLFGLASLFLVGAMGARLWPESEARRLAPWLLLGSLLWAGFCASTMFDVMLGFFSLCAMYALLCAWQEARRGYFALAGLALGLGILTKGPVVFLPFVFAVAFAPWWTRPGRGDRALPWPAWYFGALGATGIAALIALCWLVPMARGSSAEYLHDMLFKQTLGYTVQSFTHRRPIWWYLPLLPFVFFPWTLWPRAWRATAALRSVGADAGTRFCMVWAGGVFVAFSLISAKQAHYLLALFPAVALLLARLLPRVEGVPDRGVLMPAGAYLLLGLLCVLAARGVLPHHGPVWMHAMPPVPLYLTAVGFAALAVALGALRARPLAERVSALAASSCAMLLLVAWGLMRASWPAYDVRPISHALARLESAGAPLATIGRNHGQFSFYGRLRAPVTSVEAANAVEWSRAHPNGVVLAFYAAGRAPQDAAVAPFLMQPYRGGTLVAWRAADLNAHPEIAAHFE